VFVSLGIEFSRQKEIFKLDLSPITSIEYDEFSANEVCSGSIKLHYADASGHAILYWIGNDGAISVS